MCGVFGYVGKRKDDLSGFIVSQLEKLEYRGYDSAGIAVLDSKKTKVVKEIGQISNLKTLLGKKEFGGSIGIGHTRWATHGGVTKKNAHPHTDCSGEIIVVHNGIIENYEELKNGLIKKGHAFKSETDTEIFPHLIEEKMKGKKNLAFAEAVRASFNEITGLNAVVALTENEIVAFRRGSPLVAGYGKDANYISSDIPALSQLTEKIVVLDEGEGVIVRSNEILRVNAKTGKQKKAGTVTVQMNEFEASKGSFKHFMLKEIYEEPEVLLRVANNDKLSIHKATHMIKNAFGTYFTACGTAAYSGLAATYWFSEIAGKHVNFTVGSEFPYFQDFLKDKSLLIAASQSGETMDTLEAVRAAKKHKSKILALVNVPGSTLSRIADCSILLKAGPEKAVVSTKAFIAKLALFLLFAFDMKGKLPEGQKIIKETASKLLKDIKNIENQVKILSKKIIKNEHVFIIGRGINYSIALEGALKIKEASYIHSEAFAAGELKHGVIALIQKGTPCFVIVANDRAKSEILSNAMELKARGAYIIGVGPEKEDVFDFWIKVPDAKVASPIVNVVPFQLLGYYLAVAKGNNPDKPRNLAKSVTVK